LELIEVSNFIILASDRHVKLRTRGIFKMAIPTESTHLFQSGESVQIEGTYEVIGADPKASYGDEQPIRAFQLGELFPSFKGRAVCWRLTTLLPSSIPPTEMLSHSR
jgi:hypothetical protein